MSWEDKVAVVKRESEVAMDDRERDYFRQMIHDLERAKRLWQVLAFTLLAAFVLFLIVGMGSIVLYGIGNVRLAAQMREAAQMQAEEARAQAEVAALRAQEAEAATPRP